MSLENINDRGVCVALYVSYPKYRNQLSLDLFQMNAGTEGRNVLHGPGLNLMADELKAVSSAESRGRATLNGKTLNMELQIGLHFCPVAGLADLLAGIDAAKADFEAAAQEFIDNFEQHVENARNRWKAIVDKQASLPEERRAEFLQYGYDQLPSRPPRMADFVMSMLSVELTAPGLPSLADVDAAEAVAAGQAAERVRAETVSRLNHVADGFIGSCRKELQERLAKFFCEMRDLVSEGKPINRRTMGRISGFIASIRRLNFFQDAEIEKMLGRFQAVCFPDGMPNEPDEVCGVKDETAVKLVSDTVGDIVSMLTFGAEFGRDDASNMEMLAAESRVEVPETPANMPKRMLLAI